MKGEPDSIERRLRRTARVIYRRMAIHREIEITKVYESVAV